MLDAAFHHLMTAASVRGAYAEDALAAVKRPVGRSLRAVTVPRLQLHEMVLTLCQLCADVC